MLTFRLAGINNQNFIMRDEETGTFWQQVSGEAISGPLKGMSLEVVDSEEVSFAVWKAEAPGGTVLAPDVLHAAKYAPADWEQRMLRTPTVIGAPDGVLAPRELVVGLSVGGVDRAYPVREVVARAPISDEVGGTPVLIMVGPDGQTIRAFERRLGGGGPALEMGRDPSSALVDAGTQSAWEFRGCATAGPLRGQCMTPIALLKDYWFDWERYHPDSTVFAAAGR